jgi:hypothetical protein
MGKTFPGGILGGIVAAAIVGVVAWIALGAEFGIPILILAAICILAAIGYRLMAGSASGDAGYTDATDPTPKVPTSGDGRPLGDTADAHDEINPHDLPLDNPGRQTAEEMAGGDEGTTSGHDEGGAAGRGGPGGTAEVGQREAREGAEGARD